MKEIDKKKFLLNSIDDRNDEHFKKIQLQIEGLSKRDIDWLYSYFIDETKGKTGHYIHEINDYGKSISVMIITGRTFIR